MLNITQNESTFSVDSLRFSKAIGNMMRSPIIYKNSAKRRGGK